MRQNADTGAAADAMGARAFLAGGGEMGRLIRAHDWAASSLGRPEAWPQSLRTIVRLMLSSGHPMFIFWGPDLVQLYNDAYARSLGPERHPGALGGAGRACWEEIWDIIGPQIEQVMSGRGATWHEDHLVPITRHGVREDVWWTYSYSPIDEPTAENGVGGVLVICAETTERVRTARRADDERALLGRLFDQAPSFMALLEGPEHRFQLVNPSYRQLVGREVLGKTVEEAVPEAVAQGYVDRLDEAFRTGRPFRALGSRLLVQPEAGGPLEEHFIDFVYQPIVDGAGAVTGIFVEGSDVTERALAELARRESEDRFRTLADNIPILCWMANANGDIFWYNSRWYEYTGTTPESQVGWGWTWAHDPAVLPAVMTRWTESIASGDPFEMTFPLRGADGQFRPFLTRIVPLRNEDGEIVRWFGTNTDVSVHQRQEQHLRLMVEELNHRVKNTLATVQSIVGQTLRRQETSAHIREDLTARLLALSHAHDVLTNEKWSGADLHEIVAQAAAPYRQKGREDRFVLDGPNVRLTPRTAIALALALHELATNAAKYGALSTPEGRVELDWTLEGDDRLRLTWRERGGPVVTAPTRTGFGTRLIQRGLAAELGGRVELSFLPEGVVCIVEAQLGDD